ncbi:PspC domain-containing protein [Segatella cerevisiae]|nr:PspC domain-containing protein [Segatella cerevisiae]
MKQMDKKLTRSMTDAKLGGVCAGIAHYFDVDPTWIRIAYVVFTVITCIFTGIIVYIALYLIIPKDTTIKQDGEDSKGMNTEDTGE